VSGGEGESENGAAASGTRSTPSAGSCSKCGEMWSIFS
jgi:hypothetical protein